MLVVYCNKICLGNCGGYLGHFVQVVYASASIHLGVVLIVRNIVFPSRYLRRVHGKSLACYFGFETPAILSKSASFLNLGKV